MRAAAVLLGAALALACGACKAWQGPGNAGRTPSIGAMERSLPSLHPLEGVQPGMSAQQVKDLLGKPQVVEKKGADGQTEVWYYQAGAVLLRQGKVTLVVPARPGG